MDIIYIADLDFIAKREIKSLPQFYGARFSAFLRFACRKANIKLDECAHALLPFRSGTRHIHIGEHLRLRLLLNEYGKEKLPYLCNAIFSTDEMGEFNSDSLQLVSVIDAVVNKIANYAAKHSQINFFDYHDGNLIYDKRNELLDQFDKKILTFYEKIKRWAKDTAVVPVKQQACYGCFIKINDKTYAEVLKGEEIVNCLHCGRILYKGEEETAVTEA